MKYRLKNKALEEVLRGSIKDFDKRLQRQCAGQWRDSTNLVHVPSSGPDIAAIVFRKDAIEVVPEYNSKSWNKYPEVTPPEGTVMRVEGKAGSLEFKSAAVFTNGEWKCANATDCRHLYNGAINRFRPWLTDDEIEAERKAEYKKRYAP